MKKITFIIINYCTAGLIEKSINNILDSYENCEIIFVDNDSPDGSADLAHKKFGNNPKVTLIRSKNNGLSAGYNLGLAKSTGDYILYLGTDAFPSSEVLTGLVKYMDENKDVGISTARLHTRDGKNDIDAHRGFPTPWASLTHLFYLDKIFPKSKIFSQYFMGYMDFNVVHEIDACISHFMFVRPEVHKKIGNWDESFFLYGEDIDLCYRTKNAGYKIMYMGNMPVLHYKGASVGRNISADIDNVTNTDFESITFKDQRIEKKNTEEIGNKNSKTSKVIVQNTKLWVKIKLAKESTRAMKIFYKKHYIKKYPFFLNWLVFLGIWFNEKLKVAKVVIENY